MNKIVLKPLYKWTGGKRQEIKDFIDYLPSFIGNEYTYVEPFFGGGAVYWYLNNNTGKNIINDIDYDLILFLKNIKNQNSDLINKIKDIDFNLVQISNLEKLKEISIADAKTKRGEYFYNLRNLDRNNGLETIDDTTRTLRFFVVNQLSFNGMRRFNSKGEFNIPYGNYKSLSNIELLTDQNYIKLLNNTEIYNTDYKDIIINNDKENTFIFLDPPYTRIFNEYSHNNGFGEKEHIELSNILKSLKSAKFMLIINKDEFTMGLYSDYIKKTYGHKYSTNIKNRFDNTVEHIIITNY